VDLTYTVSYNLFIDYSDAQLEINLASLSNLFYSS